MTGWNLEIAMRHIPEDELHAYLDQALSRSQCVEIECHLADCRRCQIERNGVAAVRDRTTALLADVAPRRVRIPAYDQIAARGQARRSARLLTVARLKRVGLIAAGIAAAVGAGWFTRGIADRPVPTTVALTTAPVAPAIAERSLVRIGEVTPVGLDTAASSTATDGSGRNRGLDVVSTRVRAARPVPGTEAGARTEQVLQVSAIGGEDEVFALDGLWQAVDLSRALDETAGNLPRIDGLPIVDIQLQRTGNDQRPLVVVSQQTAKGEIVRTIEGPDQQVQELVAKQAARRASFRASIPEYTQPDYLEDGTSGVKRGLRMLTVTGSLPTDSLNAMARSIDRQ